MRNCGASALLLEVEGGRRKGLEVLKDTHDLSAILGAVSRVARPRSGCAYEATNSILQELYFLDYLDLLRASLLLLQNVPSSLLVSRS